MIQRISISLILISVVVCSTVSNAVAGALTLKRGQLWVKSSFIYQKTDERYYSRNTPCPSGHDCTRSGQRVPFPFDGESEFSGVYWELNYGLTDHLELKVQVPFFDIEFTDVANPDRPSTSGIGDIRFGARYRLINMPVVSTFKIEAKAPTGFFNKEAEVVPVGDGQWDLEFGGQFGKSLWPQPAYVNLDLGYRIRFAPDITTSSKDPGNEFFFRGEGGYNVLKSLLIKAAVEGLYGNNFQEGDFTVRESERRVLYFEPGIYWVAKAPLALEAFVRFSLSGKNFTAGEIYGFGLSYTFSILN